MAGPAAQPQDRRLRRPDVGRCGSRGRWSSSSRRPGTQTAYLTLRDPDVDMSFSVTVRVTTLDAMAAPLAEGARVVVHAKPTFWTKRGTLHAGRRRQIRPVGVGELLARLEHLKRLLAAEGLFDARAQAAAAVPAPAGSAWSAAGPAPPSATWSRTPAAAGRRSASRSAQVAVQGPRRRDRGHRRAARAGRATRTSTSSSSPAAAGSSRTCCRSATRPCVRAVAACRDPGRQRHRPRGRHPAARPRRRRPRLHPDRRRQAGRARRRPRSAPRSPPPGPGCTAPSPRASPPSGATWSSLRSRPVHGRPDRDDRRPPPGARCAHRALPPPGAGQRAPRRRPDRAPAARRSGPCPRCPRSSAATPWCSTPTAGWSWTAGEVEADELLRVRVARGDFGVRPVS